MARKKAGRGSAPASATASAAASTASSPAATAPGSPVNLKAAVHTPVGLSLGSRYGCVAIFKDGVGQVIANEDGERATPLWITYADGHELLGSTAKQASLRHTRSAIVDAPLLLGLSHEDADNLRRSLNGSTPFVDGAWEIEEGEETRRVTPVDATALLIRRLKETAESNLGTPITEAVITVPASFAEAQRRAVVEAAGKAGLSVQRLLNEPTAAALSMNVGQTHGQDRDILVLDLGANSLDMTLLASFGGIMEVVAAERSDRHGCKNLDDMLANHLAADFKRKTRLDISDNARARIKLRMASEMCKRALSSAATAPCTVESLHEGQDLQSTLNRPLFESLSAPYFGLVKESIEAFIAKHNASGVHAVLVMGGGANIPRFQSLVASLLPSAELIRPPAPDECAACGAAFEASLLQAEGAERAEDEHAYVSVNALDVSVGVEGADGAMVTLLRRGCPAPAKRSVKLSLPPAEGDADRSALISVYAGESAKAKENTLLCQLALQKIHAHATEVEVTASVNAHGKLTVTALDRADHKAVTVTL